MARLFVAVLSALARVRQPAHGPDGGQAGATGAGVVAEEAPEYHSICLPLLQADRDGRSPAR